MDRNSDVFALANEMATKIADALYGAQPYGKEEANLLKDRYVAIYKELISYERFVDANPHGFYL